MDYDWNDKKHTILYNKLCPLKITFHNSMLAIDKIIIIHIKKLFEFLKYIGFYNLKMHRKERIFFVIRPVDQKF